MMKLLIIKICISVSYNLRKTFTCKLYDRPLTIKHIVPKCPSLTALDEVLETHTQWNKHLEMKTQEISLRFSQT